MKKIGITLLVAMFVAITINSFAQSENEIEREVIIIKEKIDADGNKSVKKLVKRGYNITDKDIEKMMSELEESNAQIMTKPGKTKTIEKEIIIEMDEEQDKDDLEKHKLIWIDDETGDIELGEKKKMVFIKKSDDSSIEEEIEITIINNTDGDITYSEGEIELGEDVEEMIRKYSGADHKPKMGIMIQDVENGTGIEVIDVIEDSPAEKAGLQKGDIIKKIDQLEVNNMEALLKTMDEKELGAQVSVSYERDKKMMTSNMTLEKVKQKVIIRKEIIEKQN